MKTLTKYLNEKLVINKSYKDAQSYTCTPKTFEELRKIINDRYNKLGPCTKNNPIDFNDVDVSNIDSFYNENINIGIFQRFKFEYIDVSDWDVSNIKNMRHTFFLCTGLKFIGDLSNWDVSKVEDMSYMCFGCEQLKSVGDLSKLNVSKVEDMTSMFESCKQLKSVGDLSNWNVSKVKDMFNMFKDSGITNIPDWYKE